jgi:hypothetical protein
VTKNRNKKKSASINQNNKFQQIKKEINNPIISSASALCSIIGFIVFFLNGDLVIKIGSILVAVILLLMVSYSIRRWLKQSFINIFKWLTLKNIALLFIGIIIGNVLSPYIFQPFISVILKNISPQVNLFYTEPEDGKDLWTECSGVKVNFNKPVPWPYYRFTKVDILPKINFETKWEENFQSLIVYPKKQFYGEPLWRMRFDFNTIYELLIEGPFLSKPIKFKFHTPDSS